MITFQPIVKLAAVLAPLIILFSLSMVGIGNAGDPRVKQQLTKAQQAYDRGDFTKVLELVDPLIGDHNNQPSARRLKMLSLASLGKTSQSVDEYDRLVKKSGKDNEELLRRLAIASIIPFLDDMREQIRGASYTALKEINSEKMVPYLEKGLADGSGMIRALAAEGLGKLEGGQRSKQFRKGLQDQAGLVRVVVLKGLGGSGDPTVVRLIKPFLKDKQEVVQVAAAGALFRLGRSEYWDRVVKGTQVKEGYERGAALRLLGKLGDPRGLPILKKGLEDPQPSIRAAAVASLGELGLPEGIPLVMPMLSETRTSGSKCGCGEFRETQSQESHGCVEEDFK